MLKDDHEFSVTTIYNGHVCLITYTSECAMVTCRRDGHDGQITRFDAIVTPCGDYFELLAQKYLESANVLADIYVGVVVKAEDAVKGALEYVTTRHCLS